MTKTLPPALVNPIPRPQAPDFSTLVAWQEAQAQVDAGKANTKLAQEYLATTFPNFLSNYSAGRLPWNAVPPQPPVMQYALITELDSGFNLTQVTWGTIDDPNGQPVCAVPAYTRQPAPQGGTISLMGLLVNEGASPDQTLVPLVDAGQSTKSTDGKTLWLRLL